MKLIAISLIMLDVWSIFLIIGVFQGFFIIPLLLRKNKYPGKWLSLMVFAITFNLINYLAINLNLYHVWPHFINLASPFLFLLGPSFYLYIKSLTNENFRIDQKDVVHLVPFILVIFYHLEFYFYPGEYKIRLFDFFKYNDIESVPYIVLVYTGAHVLQTLFYLILSFKILKELNLSSNKKDEKLSFWLRKFCVFFGIYWLVIFIWILYLTFASGFFYEVDLIVMLATSFLINLLAFVVIYYNSEFSSYLLDRTNKKYIKSSLSEEHSKAILKKLVNLMEHKKIYTNPSLKISDLAQELNTSTNIISQVINQEMKMNFFEFVNNYRINEAMRRLSDPKFSHITIIGIANDSGFANKNTFNRLFKEQTGLTPSQFIRKQ